MSRAKERRAAGARARARARVPCGNVGIILGLFWNHFGVIWIFLYDFLPGRTRPGPGQTNSLYDFRLSTS